MQRSKVLAAVVAAVFCAAVAPAHGGDPAQAPADRPGAVPRGYDDAREAVRQEGRSLVGLVAAGDVDALFARFTPALAREVPKESLRELLGQTLALGPVGALLAESALPLGPENRAYGAEHRQADQVLRVQFTFGADGRIGSLQVGWATPLPEDPAAGYRPKTPLQLPVSGTWWVFWGGPDELRNYHATTPAQRHAYDLVQWRRGGTARGGGTRNRDYHAWGDRVVAPADAVVREARDGVRDNRPQVETNTRVPSGNHVVLDLGGDEYAELAHLRRGSVRVRVGERVRAGQPLGRVGNSGNSSEPHLHFHLQDRPDLSDAIGLPVIFRDIAIDGVPRQGASPVQGEFISRAR